MRQHITLSVTPAPAANGRFEVLAITSGTGNGYHFGRGVLRRSMPLWEGVECFVDHGGRMAGSPSRSVRDLGGIFSQPCWDASAGGIRLCLSTLGPSGPLVDALGREMLAGARTAASPGKKGPRVGFSADIGFNAREMEVIEILRVFSVDLVFNPARGGEFVREIESSPLSNGSTPENGDFQPEPARRGETVMAAENQNNEVEALRSTLQLENSQPDSADQQLARLREAQVQMCACLLETGLAASKLPRPVQDSIRKQLGGRAFEPSELTSAIENGRSLLSALTGAASVQGPRIGTMYDSRDQLQAAADELLGAPREPGLEGVRPARLSGIRELYLTLTGDYDMHGGYHPERLSLATTADFTGLVKNALNKSVANRWRELGRAGYEWWQKICTVEHFETLNQVTGTLVGTVGSLPVVQEGAAYTELQVGDSPETASFIKYGGYIPLTLELIDRDETRKLKAYPRELASAGLRKISELVAAVFTQASGVGPDLADGGALFNATAVSTAGGHSNLGSAELSAAAWEAARNAVFDQPLLIKNAAGVTGTGPKMGVDPRYLLVPRALQLAAMKIVYPTLENSATIYSENQQRGQPGDVITVPEWSDAKDWAAACDPSMAPAIFVGERFGILPEVFIAGDELSPAVFTNDEHRLKVRHFLAVWVNDFRPLYKSNVAG